jgi:diacylglycerol kinase family enzyme
MPEIERSILLIANNNAKRRTLRKAYRLERAAKLHGFTVDLQFTQSAEQAQELVSGDISRFGVVGIVGGDGSVNAIVTALRKKTEKAQQEAAASPASSSSEQHVPVLAAFGGGSTDLVRKRIGMPKFGANRAITALEQGLIYDSDLIKVTIDKRPEIYALSDVSLGLTAKAFKGERPLSWLFKKGKGGLFHLLKVPKLIAGARHLDADVEIHNGEEILRRRLDRSTDFVIHNAGSLSVFPINPDKTYDSGFSETIAYQGRMASRPRINALRAIGSVLYDSYGVKLSPSQERLHATKIEMMMAYSTPVQIDGDYVGDAQTKLTAEHQPQALRLLAPDQKTLRRRGFKQAGETVVWKDPTPPATP